MFVSEVTNYLDIHQLKYLKIQHSRAYTAQEIAESASIHGDQLAKTVILKNGEQLLMVVIPANFHIVFNALEEELHISPLVLATEAEFRSSFPKCELGAIAPIGELFGMPVFIADSIANLSDITFSAGSHECLVKMAYRDYYELVSPKVFRSAGTLSSETAPRVSRKSRHFFH